MAISHRRVSCIAAIFIGLVVSASAAQPIDHWLLQDQAKVSATGAELSQVAYKPQGWYHAVVPGTVLTSLVKAGVYPEPLYGENNRSIPESLCRTSYWYRAEFTAPAVATGQHQWLRFDGINYFANVWVNGHLIGSIKGAFTRGWFDVTAAINPGRRCAVAVEILPPPHPGNPLEQTVKNGTGPNGGAIGADSPTFLATVGWDWIPGIRDRDMGLWQGVSLGTTGPVTVTDPYVVTTLPLPKTDSADIAVQSTLTNYSDKAEAGELLVSFRGIRTKFQVAFTLQPGESKVVAAPPVYVDHPPLWWPNGYGPQNLCEMNLSVALAHGISDTASTSFGIHSISYFRPGDKNMTISVNGVPIMCKGGNWGMDEAMKRSPRKRLEAQLRMHHDANCTMVRNWIGMSTQEDFYAACDKYGILIWDDFWLANPVDGPNPLHPDIFLQNAREKIVRFRNHPSVGVWCGRNEGNPPKAIDDGLVAMTHELDPQRFYQKGSAAVNGVGGGGPYSARPLNTYFTNVRDALHTEIGAPSIPTLEAVHEMMPRKDWWPLNDDWAEHDLCRGAQGGDRYAGLVGDRYGPVTGLPDFVRKSQLMNYEVYRAIFEGRNAKLFAPASGVLLWMSNPCQPSFVWQLYSYDLEPNSALFGTEKACEPIHIQMSPVDGRVQVINNTPTILSAAKVTMTRYAVDGTRIQTVSKTVNAAACAATDALTVDAPTSTTHGVEFVRLDLVDAGGKPLSSNFYWRTIDGSNDCTALATMGNVGLDVSANRVSTGAISRIRVELTNHTKSVALMAHIQLRKATSGDRVLPVFYSDNYVSLLPGESRTIRIECATDDLGEQAPKIVVDGWNTVVREGSSHGDVPVDTNDEAFRRW